MRIIDNLIIVLFIIGSFASGLCLAGIYWRRLLHQWQYIAKILAAQNGVGYVAPPNQEHEPLIGEDFMECLLKNGRAIKTLRTTRNAPDSTGKPC